MKCVVFGGADISDYDAARKLLPPPPFFSIAADRGLVHCIELGISPDVLIGDFDSLGDDLRIRFSADIPVVIGASADKDDTDTLLAVKYATDKNISRDFVFFGGIGGRFGHSLANVQTLSFLAAHEMEGVFFGDDCTVRVLVPRNGRREFPISSDIRYISVFSLSDISEIVIGGLKYSGRFRLERSFPLGVSNAPCGTKSWNAEVLSGEILIVEEKL